MKNRLKFLPLCLMLAFAIVPALKAQSDDAAKPAHERGPRGGRGGPSIEMLTEKLGLTADQQAKIAPLLKQQEEQMQAIRKDKSLSKEDGMQKMKAIREQTHKDIAALLTPDQAKKFAEMGANGPRGDRPKGEKKEKGDQSDK